MDQKLKLTTELNFKILTIFMMMFTAKVFKIHKLFLIMPGVI